MKRTGETLMSVASQAPARAIATGATRWGQLIFGIICMVMIANLQYGWTLFVNPIDQKYHWGRAAIQVAFTIFVLTETWLVPVEGYLIDKFGPKIMVCVSGAAVFCMSALSVRGGPGGRRARAPLSPVGHGYRMARLPASILGVTLPALSFALSTGRAPNAGCRTFFCWVSDRIRRDNTML